MWTADKVVTNLSKVAADTPGAEEERDPKNVK